MGRLEDCGCEPRSWLGCIVVVGLAIGGAGCGKDIGGGQGALSAGTPTSSDSSSVDTDVGAETSLGSGSDASGGVTSGIDDDGSDGPDDGASAGDDAASESGEVDCTMEVTSYLDSDGDGYGDPSVTSTMCPPPEGYALQGGDCNEINPDIHPGIDEICDNVDQDCDGIVDEFSPANATCSGCTLKEFEMRTYWFCTGSQPWAQAEAQCVAKGVHLTSVHTPMEQEFLRLNTDPLGPERWWLGVNDQAVEDSFVWTDGTPYDYDNWEDGEPNNDDGDEHCGELRLDRGGEWNDVPCDLSRAYICRSP